MNDLSGKLQDPTYDITQDCALPPNAFLEPNNPNAVFPQNARPHILDFRSHKMAASGFAAKGNFRKILSDRAKQSKYQSVVTTREEMDDQAQMKAMMESTQVIVNEEQDSDEEEIDITKIKKSYTVDDITKSMGKQMKISKKKGGNTVDIDMGPKKTIQKSKVLKETHKKKRSRSQLKF